MNSSVTFPNGNQVYQMTCPDCYWTWITDEHPEEVQTPTAMFRMF
jgi:hypothetical protein